MRESTLDSISISASDGAQLRVHHVRMSGAHATIVFLHDSLGCIKLWRDFPEILASALSCNVLVYDRQGYGESSPFSRPRAKTYLEEEVDVLFDVLEKSGVQEPVLFGHSDGGSVALIAAAMRPDAVAAVITEGAHVFVEDITVAGIRNVAGQYATSNLKPRLEKYHGDKTDAVFRTWAETWQANEFRDWNIEKYLPSILCPVMAIQGESDEFGSVKQVDAIVEQVKGPSVKCMIPNIGHTPHKEDLAATLKASIEFLSPVLAAEKS